MYFFKFLFVFFIFANILYAYPNYSSVIKEKKMYPIGKKIYERKCHSINLQKYSNFSELERDIVKNNICTKLNKKYSDALLLFLWEVKRDNSNKKYYEKLSVTKDDKCPVCGMLLYKYPRWVSRIEYKDKKVSFDGIKDMMKYYFEHLNGIKNILVQDYYTQETIDAKKAYFVVGSNVYGPMGNELIAFKDRSSAEKFELDHKGKKIIFFPEITQEEVYKLDE